MTDFAGPLTQGFSADAAPPASAGNDVALPGDFQVVAQEASDIREIPLNARGAVDRDAWATLRRPALWTIKNTAIQRPTAGTFQDVFAALTTRSICRGQMQNGGAPIVWETAGAGVGFNYTFFPVVGRLSVNNASPTWTTYMYCALYSQVPPSHVGGQSATEGVLHHRPTYTDVQTTGNDSAVIKVDSTHIGDQNAWLSVFSALQNTRAQDGWYLSFFPVVSDQHFNDRVNRDGRHAWAVKGPSLGLAVAAAVLGAAPVMYTGYLKTLFPNGTTDDALRSAYPNYRQPNVPGARMPYPSEGPRVLSGQLASYQSPAQRYSDTPVRYGAPGLALSTVMENVNYVETVHYLPQKVQLAIALGMPIVIPFYNSMGERMETYIRSVNFQQTSFLIKMHSRTYTCADAQDGRSVIQLAPNIFIAATLAEATILGAFATMVYYQIAGFAAKPFPEYMDQVASSGPDVAPDAARQLDNIAAREAKSRQRAKELSEQLKPFKKNPNVEEGTAQMRQFLLSEATKAAERADQRSAAALARKAGKDRAKAEGTAIRKAQREAKIGKMKTKYEKGERQRLLGKGKPSARGVAARAILKNSDITRAPAQKRTTRTRKQLEALANPSETAQEKQLRKAADARQARQMEQLQQLLGNAPAASLPADG